MSQSEFDDVSDIFVLRYSDGMETSSGGKAAIAGYSCWSEKNQIMVPTRCARLLRSKDAINLISLGGGPGVENFRDVRALAN